MITGFTSAAAISIASSQLKGLFGLAYDSETVIEAWSELIKNISHTKWQDLTLGICSMVALLFMRVSVRLVCIVKVTVIRKIIEYIKYLMPANIYVKLTPFSSG